MAINGAFLVDLPRNIGIFCSYFSLPEGDGGIIWEIFWEIQNSGKMIRDSHGWMIHLYEWDSGMIWIISYKNGIWIISYRIFIYDPNMFISTYLYLIIMG